MMPPVPNRRVLPFMLVMFMCGWPCLPVSAQRALSEADRLARRRTPVVDVFERTKDSVVNIASTQIIEMRSPGGIGGLFDDIFDFGLGQPRVRRFRQTSVGSGFVIHEAGYIVTNAHVVARTAERKIIFDDNGEFDADIVAIDTDRDLAVLKIDPGNRRLKPITLGTSRDLMRGETVVAIGNPLGFAHTVTAGVVSATDRDLPVNDKITFKGLIQTDASINPGNSGGPLLNILGELVGINTAIRADAQNIGFAIPVDDLRRLLPEMLDVERRYRIVTGLRVSGSQACKVTALVADGPAVKAGIELGDVVTRVGDASIRNSIDFYIALIGKRAGQSVPITVRRDGNESTRSLSLAARPKPNGQKLLIERFGIEAAPVTPRVARDIGIDGLKGLLVNRVLPGSAQQIGLQRGDIILALGRFPTADMDGVGEILEEIRPGQQVQVTILRVTQSGFVRATGTLKAQ